MMRKIIALTFLLVSLNSQSMEFMKSPTYLDSIKDELSDSLLDMFEEEEDIVTRSCEELQTAPWYYSFFRFSLEARFSKLQSKIKYRECQHIMYFLNYDENSYSKDELCSDEITKEISNLQSTYISIKNSEDRDDEELSEEHFQDSKTRLDNLRMLNYIICH